MFIRTWSLCACESPFSICFRLLSTSLEITAEVLGTCLSNEGVEERLSQEDEHPSSLVRLSQEDEDPSRGSMKQSTL